MASRQQGAPDKDPGCPPRLHPCPRARPSTGTSPAARLPGHWQSLTLAVWATVAVMAVGLVVAVLPVIVPSLGQVTAFERAAQLAASPAQEWILDVVSLRAALSATSAKPVVSGWSGTSGRQLEPTTHQVTGNCSRPRRNSPRRQRGAREMSARRRSGNRPTNVLIAICPSRRASAAPRQ